VKPYILSMPVTPYCWRLYLFNDREKYAAFAKKHTGHDDERLQTVEGYCITRPQRGEVYVGVFVGAASTLVHELTHAVFWILESVGVPLTGECSEASAYLMGHLYEECTAALNAASKPTKKKR
jgi:hypothetical protein